MAALTAAPAALSGCAALQCSGTVSSTTSSSRSISLCSRRSLQGKPLPVVRSSLSQRWRGRAYRPLHVTSVATTKELDLKLEDDLIEDTVDEEDEVEDEEEDESLIPNGFEIQSLLMELCDETSVAELQLKVGSFKLHVRRDVKGRAAEVPVAPPVPSKPMIESIPVAAPVAAKPAPVIVDDSDDEDLDEGLAYLVAPKVGIFRRGRFIKGKAGKPMVVEGTEVKKGQVVGYLEQLGTQLAIEADQAGEVVKFPVEDGDPVGFADPVITIRPFFPGIKKLT